MLPLTDKHEIDVMSSHLFTNRIRVFECFLKQISNHIWSYLFHCRLLEGFFGKRDALLPFRIFQNMILEAWSLHFFSFIYQDMCPLTAETSFKMVLFHIFNIGAKNCLTREVDLKETPNCQEGSSFKIVAFKAISGPQLRPHPDCCFWWIHSPIILPDTGSIEYDEVWQREVPEYKGNSKVTHTFRIYEPI